MSLLGPGEGWYLCTASVGFGVRMTSGTLAGPQIDIIQFPDIYRLSPTVCRYVGHWLRYWQPNLGCASEILRLPVLSQQSATQMIRIELRRNVGVFRRCGY